MRRRHPFLRAIRQRLRPLVRIESRWLSQGRTSPWRRLLDRAVWWGAQYGKDSIQELPTTRRIWSILENQETSTVTDRLDSGGLETARPALFGALGASWTENQYSLNGFNV